MTDAITGGCLVLAGVLATELVRIFVASTDRKERRQKLLREKYEELSKNILDTNVQVMAMLKMPPKELRCSFPPEGPQAVQSLARIYFPELPEPACRYNESVVQLYRFLLRSADPSICASVSAQNLENTDFYQMLEASMAAKAHVEEYVEMFATTYTKA